jgi:methionine biosynthesis protein MetW
MVILRMGNPDNPIRLDHKIIVDLIPDGSSVLDLGCGNGELLDVLLREKNVIGSGIEIDEQAVYQCVEKGLSVFHGDIDSGIADYNDKSFDYVILNQTLQQVKHLEIVFNDSLRVGRNVIVGLPNFAHLDSRTQLFFGGKAPVTPSLPYQWYSTPNLHFCSISDFLSYCAAHKITVQRTIYLGKKRRLSFLPDLFAQMAIFLISKQSNSESKDDKNSAIK